MIFLRVVLVCVTIVLFVNLSESFGQLNAKWRTRFDPKLIRKNGIIGPKIVGGVNASQYQAPWQISLVATVKIEGSLYEAHICGGSIITPNAILTAAHCCDDPDFDSASFKVKYGGTDWYKLYHTTNIKKIIIHPKWNRPTLDFDFCIIHLETSVLSSDTVKIIPISERITEVGARVNLTGWGLTNGLDPSSVAPQLQFVTLSTISNTECNQKWSGHITNNMICAGKQNASACMGDSGGPLVKDGQLVGVVSWGHYQCDPNTIEFPSVYSNPVAVSDWIKENGASSSSSLSIHFIIGIISSILLFPLK